jgi:predicted site-specific integrase-resolvase
MLDLNTLFHQTSGRRLYPWSKAEAEALKRCWGRVPRPLAAERVSQVLRRLTGDPGARRTVAAISVRAQQMGLRPYQGDEAEIFLSRAAELVGVPCRSLFEDARDGRLPTVRRGKQRYVTPRDLSIWFLAYRDRQETQAGVLECIENEDIITKKEAMALSGLAETHLTRYLKTGVIRAWKVPDLRDGERGDWAVDRRSVVALIKARAKGELANLLDEQPDYVRLRKRMTKEVRDLRQACRLGRRDPLTTPKSRYHPGCFTIAQVASHLGVATQSLYEAIKRGDLEARVVTAGGRKRYAITRDEARRYAGTLKTRKHPIVQWNLKRKRAIHNHGLLMTDDLAQRYGYSPEAVCRWVRVGLGGHKLRARRFGRYLVFEPGDVEAFERVTGIRRLEDVNR